MVIDLKIGSLTHADAGQMHFYLNYARQHWVREGENPPVGLILCSEKDEALAQYALEGLSNTVMAAEYRITLPDEELLAAELDRTRQAMELRGSIGVGAQVAGTLPEGHPEDVNEVTFRMLPARPLDTILAPSGLARHEDVAPVAAGGEYWLHFLWSLSAAT